MSSISVGISQSLLASWNLDNVKPIFEKCVHIPPHLSAFLFSGRRFSDKIQPSLWSSTLRTFLLVLPKLTVGPIEVKPAAAYQVGNWENRWAGWASQCQVLTAQVLICRTSKKFFYTLMLWSVCDCLPNLQLHMSCLSCTSCFHLHWKGESEPKWNLWQSGAVWVVAHGYFHPC